MLSVQSVSHAYESKPVLRDISFDVDAGQIVAIMGTSGGGKTTLLRCIGALLKPTEGKILVDGIDVVSEPEKARAKIGMVFQSAALFDYLNVEENILFGAKRQRRYTGPQLREKLDMLLEQLSLGDIKNQMPSELSGGMQKRVGLARALAMEPQLILYDEPTSGLDPVIAYSIDHLIRETRDRLGVTSLVVSHDVTNVFRIADRVAFLEKGEITFYGSIDEFKKAPTDGISELLEKSN